ncbi:hypothetical protein Tco_0149167 [Tanacetum coccineum]
MARDNRDQLLSDLAKARKKKKKSQGSHKTPPGSLPPPSPPAGPSGTSGAMALMGVSHHHHLLIHLSIRVVCLQAPAAPSSSKTRMLQQKYTAWTMTDTRLKPSVSPIPKELHMG